jgi:hypothetical protein
MLPPMMLWRHQRVGVLAWLTLLAVVMAPFGSAAPSAVASPSPASPTLPNDPPHRYVVLLHGIRSTGTTAGEDFATIRSAIQKNVR